MFFSVRCKEIWLILSEEYLLKELTDQRKNKKITVLKISWEKWPIKKRGEKNKKKKKKLSVKNFRDQII